MLNELSILKSSVKNDNQIYDVTNSLNKGGTVNSKLIESWIKDFLDES